MEQLKPVAKLFYGLGITGIAALQFVYPWFRPVLAPIPAADTQNLVFLVYASGALLVLAGLFIAFGKNVRTVSLLLGLFFLLFLLIGHLPNRLKYSPDVLGAWTDALKLFALAGGAFIIATVFPRKINNGFINGIGKIAPYGKYFFALMLVIFGIDHFLYVDFVKALVPRWIPGEVFWTYFGTVALIGSGLAIFLNFKPKLISRLLGIMLFTWLIILHIPRAVEAPFSDNGNEWTSVFECLAFSGMAFLYPYSKKM